MSHWIKKMIWMMAGAIACNAMLSSMAIASGQIQSTGQPDTGVESYQRAPGKRVPFKTALLRILPQGWRADIRLPVASFDRNQPVSWPGQRTLPRLLADITAQAGVDAEIDWNHKLIVVDHFAGPSRSAQKTPHSSVTKTVVVVQNSNRDRQSQIASQLPQNQPVAVAVPATVAAKVYVISPKDISLRLALERWCREESDGNGGHWQLVWDAVDTDGRVVDYPLLGRADIKGPFLTAVQTVLRSYLKADFPLYSDSWPDNHMLRISNMGTK